MSEEGLSARARAIEESVTLAVSARAKELRAEGEPVIGFGAGEPDFPAPDHVIEAAQRAATDPASHRYSPAAGLPELRDAIVDKTLRDTGLELRRDHVLVSNGGKHALYGVFQTLLDPGDEVLIVAPYWVSYPEQIRLAGAEAVVVETTADDGFKASVDDLEDALTERTKLLLFVSPSNPTGVVYDPDEVAEVGRWAAERGLWVLTDEIYEHLVYGGMEFASMPVVVPEIADRCVVANGVAKTYAMTGWRVGWIAGPEQVVAAATRIQSHVTSNVCNVAQHAALAALTGPQDRVAEMRTTFDRRRKIAVEQVRRIDGVTCPEPLGAFYVFPDVRAVLGREIGGGSPESTLELAETLLETAKVAVVPGEGFGAPGCVRLSYALGDEDLEEGLSRLVDTLS